MNGPARGDRRAYSSWAVRLVRALPTPLVLAPERVVLNFGCLLIGLAALLRPPRVLEWFLPHWGTVSWALLMAFGGLAVLVGMFRDRITVERLGYVMLGPACLGVGIIVASLGWGGIASALIFISFGLVKALRLIISSAARDTVIEIGRKLEQDDERGN